MQGGGWVTNRKLHTVLNNPLSLSTNGRKRGRVGLLTRTDWFTKLKLLALFLVLSGLFVWYLRSKYSQTIEGFADFPLWFLEGEIISEKDTINALLRSNLSWESQHKDISFLKDVLLGYKTFYNESHSIEDRKKIAYQVPYVTNSLSLSFGKTKKKEDISTAYLGKALMVFTAATIKEHAPFVNNITKALIGVSGSLSFGPFVFRRMSPMSLLKVNKDDLRNFEIVTSTQKLAGNLYDGHIFHYYIDEEGSAVNPVLYAGHKVRFDYDHTGFTIPMIAPHIIDASIEITETTQEVPLSDDNFVLISSKTAIVSFSVFLEDKAYGRLGIATYNLIVKENEHGIGIKIEISAFDGVTLGRVEASFSMDAMSSISADRFYNTFYYYGEKFSGSVKHGHLDIEEYESRMMDRSSVPNLEANDYFLYDKQTQIKPINWFTICQEGPALVSPCVITLAKSFTSTTLPQLSGTTPFNEVRHSSGGKKGGFNWVETWYNISTLSSNFAETKCKKGVVIIEEKRIPVSGFLQGEQFIRAYADLFAHSSLSNIDISLAPELSAIAHGIASIYTGVCIQGILSASSYESICGDVVKNWLDAALQTSLLIAEQSHEFALNEQLKASASVSVEHIAHSIMATYKMAKYFPLNENYITYSSKNLQLLLSYQISETQDRRYGVFVCGFDPLRLSARQTVTIDCHTLATVALMKAFELFLSVEEQIDLEPEGTGSDPTLAYEYRYDESRQELYYCHFACFEVTMLTYGVLTSFRAYKWQLIDGVNLLYINQGIAKKDIAESTKSAALILELTISLEKLLAHANTYFKSLLSSHESKLHAVATKLKRWSILYLLNSRVHAFGNDVVTTHPGGDVIEAESFILSHRAFDDLLLDIFRKGPPRSYL